MEDENDRDVGAKKDHPDSEVGINTSFRALDTLVKNKNTYLATATLLSILDNEWKKTFTNLKHTLSEKDDDAIHFRSSWGKLWYLVKVMKTCLLVMENDERTPVAFKRVAQESGNVLMDALEKLEDVKNEAENQFDMGQILKDLLKPNHFPWLVIQDYCLNKLLAREGTKPLLSIEGRPVNIYAALHGDKPPPEKISDMLPRTEADGIYYGKLPDNFGEIFKLAATMLDYLYEYKHSSASAVYSSTLRHKDSATSTVVNKFIKANTYTSDKNWQFMKTSLSDQYQCYLLSNFLDQSMEDLKMKLIKLKGSKYSEISEDDKTLLSMFSDEVVKIRAAIYRIWYLYYSRHQIPETSVERERYHTLEIPENEADQLFSQDFQTKRPEDDEDESDVPKKKKKTPPINRIASEYLSEQLEKGWDDIKSWIQADNFGNDEPGINDLHEISLEDFDEPLNTAKKNKKEPPGWKMAPLNLICARIQQMGRVLQMKIQILDADAYKVVKVPVSFASRKALVCFRHSGTKNIHEINHLDMYGEGRLYSLGRKEEKAAKILEKAQAQAAAEEANKVHKTIQQTSKDREAEREKERFLTALNTLVDEFAPLESEILSVIKGGGLLDALFSKDPLTPEIAVALLNRRLNELNEKACYVDTSEATKKSYFQHTAVGTRFLKPKDITYKYILCLKGYWLGYPSQSGATALDMTEYFSCSHQLSQLLSAEQSWYSARKVRVSAMLMRLADKAAHDRGQPITGPVPTETQLEEAKNEVEDFTEVFYLDQWCNKANSVPAKLTYLSSFLHSLENPDSAFYRDNIQAWLNELEPLSAFLSGVNPNIPLTRLLLPDFYPNLIKYLPILFELSTAVLSSVEEQASAVKRSLQNAASRIKGVTNMLAGMAAMDLIQVDIDMDELLGNERSIHGLLMKRNTRLLNDLDNLPSFDHTRGLNHAGERDDLDLGFNGNYNLIQSSESSRPTSFVSNEELVRDRLLVTYDARDISQNHGSQLPPIRIPIYQKFILFQPTTSLGMHAFNELLGGTFYVQPTEIANIFHDYVVNMHSQRSNLYTQTNRVDEKYIECDPTNCMMAADGAIHLCTTCRLFTLEYHNKLAPWGFKRITRERAEEYQKEIVRANQRLFPAVTFDKRAAAYQNEDGEEQQRPAQNRAPRRNGRNQRGRRNLRLNEMVEEDEVQEIEPEEEQERPEIENGEGESNLRENANEQPAEGGRRKRSKKDRLGAVSDLTSIYNYQPDFFKKEDFLITDKSKIHNRGVLANRTFEKGDFLMWIHGSAISTDEYLRDKQLQIANKKELCFYHMHLIPWELEQFARLYRENLQDISWDKQLRGSPHILRMVNIREDTMQTFNNYGAYLNHSCKPNCELRVVSYANSKDRAGNKTGVELIVLAKERITSGTELTISYTWDPTELMPVTETCKCGHVDDGCEGFVGYKSFFDSIEKLRTFFERTNANANQEINKLLIHYGIRVRNYLEKSAISISKKRHDLLYAKAQREAAKEYEESIKASLEYINTNMYPTLAVAEEDRGNWDKNFEKKDDFFEVFAHDNSNKELKIKKQPFLRISPDGIPTVKTEWETWLDRLVTANFPIIGHKGIEFKNWVIEGIYTRVIESEEYRDYTMIFNILRRLCAADLGQFQLSNNDLIMRDAMIKEPWLVAKEIEKNLREVKAEIEKKKSINHDGVLDLGPMIEQRMYLEIYLDILYKFYDKNKIAWDTAKKANRINKFMSKVLEKRGDSRLILTSDGVYYPKAKQELKNLLLDSDSTTIGSYFNPKGEYEGTSATTYVFLNEPIPPTITSGMQARKQLFPELKIVNIDPENKKFGDYIYIADPGAMSLENSVLNHLGVRFHPQTAALSTKLNFWFDEIMHTQTSDRLLEITGVLYNGAQGLLLDRLGEEVADVVATVLGNTWTQPEHTTLFLKATVLPDEMECFCTCDRGHGTHIESYLKRVILDGKITTYDGNLSTTECAFCIKDEFSDHIEAILPVNLLKKLRSTQRISISTEEARPFRITRADVQVKKEGGMQMNGRPDDEDETRLSTVSLADLYNHQGGSYDDEELMFGDEEEEEKPAFGEQEEEIVYGDDEEYTQPMDVDSSNQGQALEMTKPSDVKNNPPGGAHSPYGSDLANIQQITSFIWGDAGKLLIQKSPIENMAQVANGLKQLNQFVKRSMTAHLHRRWAISESKYPVVVYQNFKKEGDAITRFQEITSLNLSDKKMNWNLI